MWYESITIADLASTTGLSVTVPAVEIAITPKYETLPGLNAETWIIVFGAGLNVPTVVHCVVGILFVVVI